MPSPDIKVAPSAPQAAKAEVQPQLREINKQLRANDLDLDTATDLVLSSDDLTISKAAAARIKTQVIDGHGMDIWGGDLSLACLGHLLKLKERLGMPPDQVYEHFVESRDRLARIMSVEGSSSDISLAAFLEAHLAALFQQGGETLADHSHNRLVGAALTGVANKLARFSWNHRDPRQWRDSLTRISSEKANQFLADAVVPILIAGIVFLPTRFTVYSLLVSKVSNENETKI